MVDFDVIGLTLPCLPDPAVAIAVSRAGGIGVVDLQWGDGKPMAEAILGGGFTALRRYCKGRWGVKLDGEDESVAGDLVKYLDAQTKGSTPGEVFELAILTDAPGQILARQIARLRRATFAPRRILLEVTGPDDAGAISHLDIGGVDGFIAKGEESGGFVGAETTFILLQRLLRLTLLPVWAQGGIGLHSAAACRAAGAAGVVLDSQLCLSRESSLPEAARAIVVRADGSETITLGQRLGCTVRLFNHLNSAAIRALREQEKLIEAQEASENDRARHWKEAIRTRIGWGAPDRWLEPLGQDCAIGAELTRRFKTAGGIVSAIREAAHDHLVAARAHHPLAENAPLASSHRTRFPIVQGPMTRVSDNAAFAAEVGAAGALPLIALALSSAAQTREVLTEARAALGDRPWGVGILGFVPLAVRSAQLEAIKEFRPGFALIAGGRPDQALQLERLGIVTYLHTPSPALLKLYFEQGTRRFVFEGRECGGHVGPRSSLALWDAMTAALLSLRAQGAPLDAVHVLFAGGIHDAVSASMVAALSAPLAEAGAKIGIVMGTAYLFTHEAVATGAIVPGFQATAIGCRTTALLESGPGHASRCAQSPFVEYFNAESRRLTASNFSDDDARNTLEELCLGRLRLATKGLARCGSNGTDRGADLVHVDDAGQRARGMYMIGQLAALRQDVCSLRDLHQDVCVAGSQILEQFAGPAVSSTAAQPCDIAIIGVATHLPRAPDVRRFWENILGRVDVITEIPPSRFDWRQYFDPDPAAPDKIYSKWGGFLDDLPFDPVRYGIPPNTLNSIEPMQLLTLEAVRAAIEDAGYEDRPFARSRTSVILGVGGGLADLGQQYGIRSGLPMLMNETESAGPLPQALLDRLPTWTEDSFPGLLLNVVAGRVANRFDFGGMNCTVDAACASSLAAIYVAARELTSGSSEVAIAGGIDTVQNPFAYLCFSKTKALSPHGRCRPFDASADGIVISEGLVVLVMKRLADAERDGDRIYAVLKSIAGSSDGRDKGLTAPHPDGQVAALRRAYETAGLSPATIGLIEAHGTGTVAGDGAEIEALKRVFPSAPMPMCAIGSVKSMIGHTKCAAGAAGLVKAALALHQKVLPPTINVEAPNPKVNSIDSPFFVNTELRPWLSRADGTPRRAGVSAFGFGGTNFHAVLEEYLGDPSAAARPPLARRWPSELFVWSGASARALHAAISDLSQALQQGAAPEPVDLAAALWRDAKTPEDTSGRARLAIVAGDLPDLLAKLATAQAHLAAADPGNLTDRGGIHLRVHPTRPHPGKIAFLFPGQGSQQPGMLAELAVYFREVREAFETADRVLAAQIPEGLSSHIFPPSPFTEADRKRCRQALSRTEITQPAMGAACLAMLHLLRSLGVDADVAAGHSYGEYVALAAAGALSDETLYAVSEARGRCLVEATDDETAPELGTMRAAFASAEEVADGIAGLDGVWIANVNSPRQTMLSGTAKGIARAAQRLGAAGIETSSIPVGCGFHSPLMAPAQVRLAGVLKAMPLSAPRIPVFSNTIAAEYPPAAGAAVSLLMEHLVRPVRFRDEIESMYADGARTFIEIGPRAVLTGLVGQILAGQQHLAVATSGDVSSLAHFQDAVARLFVADIPLSLDRLYEGRAACLKLAALLEESRPREPALGTWLVNGGGVRRVGLPTLPAEPPAREAAIREAAATKTPAAGPHKVSDPEVDQVMVSFQATMTRFLETQQQTMLSYLRKRQPVLPAVAAPEASANTAPRTEGRAAEPTPTVETSLIAEALPRGASAAHPPVFDRLLGIVSERTGYPAEMLKPTLDLEADLGIDSIKRVEILGAFRRGCTPDDQQKLQSAMERLTLIKTLGGLAESLAAILVSETPSASGVCRDDPPAPIAVVSTVSVSRFRLVPVDAPALGEVSVLPGGAVLVTDDGCGVATAVAMELRRLGRAVALLRMPDPAADNDEGAWRVDLTDPMQVERTVQELRQIHGRIAAVLHLLPLGIAVHSSDPGYWRQRAAVEITGLFNLAQSAGRDLRSPDLANATLLAATCLGGDFGVLPDEYAAPFPTHGGVAGFIKSVAFEWSSVRCRVIDFKAGLPPRIVAERLIAELSSSRGDPIEIGYHGGQRISLGLAPARLPLDGERQPALVDGSVVLVTGGARGITAKAVLALAAKRRLRLIVVGRSPLPADEEAPATAGLTSPVEIKRVLIDRMRRNDGPPVPAAVEAECHRLLRDREIRVTLDALRNTGCEVDYRGCDLADEADFGRLIDAVYALYGRIDGVIHGAGIIEDRLVEHKAAASFDRVMSAKVNGALLLAAKLRPESLKLLMLFSSIAGRFGNRGQADYAAANEILNKLAAHLDARWPARVVALNWGPWDGSNMVGEGVRDQFVRRGVPLIEPRDGAAAFVAEVECGRSGQPEVILCEGSLAGDSFPKALQADPVTIASLARMSEEEAPISPLLGSVPLSRTSEGAAEISLDLDPSRHPYLNDHSIDGRPVFPAAMAVELVAELARKAWPDRIVSSVRSFRICKGIVFDRASKTVRIVARPPLHNPGSAPGLSFDVEIRGADSDDLLHFKGTVCFGDRPAAPAVADRRSGRLLRFLDTIEDTYRNRLFHGPLFHSLAWIDGVSQETIVAAVRSSRPDRYLAMTAAASWTIDPVLLDAGPQLAILWAQEFWGITVLPSCFGEVRIHDGLAAILNSGTADPLNCRLLIDPASEAPTVVATYEVYGPDGRLVLSVEGLEMTGSRALNRLAAAGPPEFRDAPSSSAGRL